MGLLDTLLGGGQQRQEYDDFVGRYDRGSPWEGYSDREAMNRYRQVAPQLSRDQYQASAAEAFARLTPEQRLEFARFLQERARGQNVGFPDADRDGVDDRYQDPDRLAQLTARMEQEQPGVLERLLGGSGGERGGRRGDQDADSILDNPLAKAALAGIAAMAVRRFLSGR